MTQENLENILRETQTRTARKSLKINAVRANGLSIFDSKFGGIPYWDFSKPYPVSSEGEKLVLLSQFNFEKIPNLKGFPTHGILQFFIAANSLFGMDFDERMTGKDFRVVFHEKIDLEITEKSVRAQKIPTTFDEDIANDFPFSGEFSLSFCEEDVKISPCVFSFENEIQKTATSLSVNADDVLNDLLSNEQFDSLLEGSAGSRLGGYPFFTQDDVRSFSDTFSEYTELLFQMDSDSEISWGDSGVANFFITPQDLEKRDFSRVLYNWDCY